MKTTLPILSYEPTGFNWSEDVHSCAYTKERAYPRTDLEDFTPWGSFETEIRDAIIDRMIVMGIPLGAEYDIGYQLKIKELVECEEAVRQQAKIQLHDLVVEVLHILGIEGRFALPGSGNNHIVGEPDFSWLQAQTNHPKVVLEYKTIWAAPLEDLPAYFCKARRTVQERQSIDALFQLYGYMTFNENKYGILSNMECAWFFQRVETAQGQGNTLQYYGPINFCTDSVDLVDSPTMLKAFVGIILLAETASTWFHSSPTLSDSDVPLNRYFGKSLRAISARNTAIKKAGSYHSVIIDGSYPLLPLDPRLCHFDRTSVRHTPQRGCTLKATLGTLAKADLTVFCKVVDLFQSKDSIKALNREVHNYATLQDLQGIVIPRVHGYYEVWGLLRLLALEDVGTAIPENGPINIQTRSLMKSALARIHLAGYVHGDIARRNFCKKADMVFLVDLETLARGNRAARKAELAQIDAL